MRTRSSLLAVVLAVLAIFALLGGPTPVESQAPATATISGNAYTFNTRNVIVGATIRAEEFPEISTTTAADGSYTLEFPVESTVTLSIEAAGHGRIRIQTFTLDDAHDGTEIVGANFQTPNDQTYTLLSALIEGYVGRDPFEGGCVIVTTVGMRELEGMPFEEFIRFAPHGVEGATAHISPADATPIYFNESVIPDLAQTTTSNDGGVLWPNVPVGTYQLSATHPEVDFTTANIRCEEGWVVNANPVWGLHAIDPTTTTTSTTTASTVPTTVDTTVTTVTPSLPTTPSTEPTTTTGDGSTSSTVEGPTSSTSAPAVVDGGRTGQGGTGGGELSRTGSDSARLATIALGLLGGGSLLVVFSRRRRLGAGS